jgi:eukaryotic-like serine/threonine-protein kinase
MASVLSAGAVVAGRYVVESLLGAGGMGAVYRCRDTTTDGVRAIKVLRDARGELAARFVREARIAAALTHPNIARVLDVVTLDDEAPAIVMELLSGESLGARLSRVGKLQAGQAASILLSVVAGVRAAHERGVVHRDLKPDNVFLCDDGTVKVLDFGIAKVMLDSDDPAVTVAALTETGQILGTPHYMAPEQIFGEKDVDGRADVWALGVVLYEALAGVRPFQGENAGQVFKAIALDPYVPLADRAPACPPELLSLVTSMLVHARAERIADLGHVADVLARVAEADVGIAETASADAPALPSALPARPTRKPAGARLWLGAGIMLAAGSAAIAASWLRTPAPEAAVTVSEPPPPATAVLPPNDLESEAPTAPDVPPQVATSVPEPLAAGGAARRRPSPKPSVAPRAEVLAVPAPAVAPPAAPDAGTHAHRSGALRRDEF